MTRGKFREAQELRGIRRGRVTPEQVSVRRRMRGAEPDLSIEDLSAFVPPRLQMQKAYQQMLIERPELMMGEMGGAPFLERQKTRAETARLEAQTGLYGKQAEYYGRMPQIKSELDFGEEFLGDVQAAIEKVKLNPEERANAYWFLSAMYPHHREYLEQLFMVLTPDERMAKKQTILDAFSRFQATK